MVSNGNPPTLYKDRRTNETQMTVIHEFDGWVLTDGGVVLHACLSGPVNISIARCSQCDVWITEKIFEHMEKVWNFTEAPDQNNLADPGKPVYTRRR
jgi:hypothetical protein